MPLKTYIETLVFYVNYCILVPATGAGATVMSNGGIPVGIAVARQRFVSNSSGKSQTTSKDVIATSSAAATSYSSIVPYQQTLIEPSMFASSISNIGECSYNNHSLY